MTPTLPILTMTTPTTPDATHFTTRSAAARRLCLGLSVGALLVASLSGCVPLVVGAAAAGGLGMVATDRRSSGAQLDDEGIELRGGARVREIAGNGAHINITSFNRQVLLTGEVASATVRQRAEEVVARIDNVSGVVDALVVTDPSSLAQRSNDTYITGKVKASLLDAKDVFANVFKVVTERNVVYLMGRVTRREADRATDIARGVGGVVKVVRVLEILSEAELAGQVRSDGSSAAPVTSTTPPMAAAAPSSIVQPTAASSGSSVALPPMEPLPAEP